MGLPLKHVKFGTKVAHCIRNIISKSRVTNMAAMVTLRLCPEDLTQINLCLNLSPSTEPSNKTITGRMNQAKLKIYKTFHFSELPIHHISKETSQRNLLLRNSQLPVPRMFYGSGFVEESTSFTERNRTLDDITVPSTAL